MREHQLASCGTRKPLLGGLPVNGVTPTTFAGCRALHSLILFGLTLLFRAMTMPLCAQALPGPGPATLRVDYVGTDLHIHETYLSGGTWQDSDLTILTGGPLAESDTPIADIVDPIQNATTVSYVATDSHLHQLSLSNGAWHDSDLTAATGAPQANGTALATVLDTIENFVRLHYVGVDLHVHELYDAGGAWHDFDLTAATGAPAAMQVTPVANVVDTVENMLRVDYVAGDSHVHEFYIANNSWHDHDLTLVAHGPDVFSPAGIADMVDTIENIMRVHYVGADMHLHELYDAGGAWHDYDLTAVTGGPQTTFLTFIANVIDTTQNVIRVDYVGGGSAVHEFFISGGAWYDYNLTVGANAVPPARGTPIANIPDTVQNTMRVHYVANDSHLHEFYISGGSWHDYDLTANTGGPQVQPLTSIANVLDFLH